VAVGAHEHALERLFAVGRQRLAAAHLDLERLLGRHHMVEVQVPEQPVVAAHRATAAGLIYESALELAVAAGDRFADTATTAIPDHAPIGERVVPLLPMNRTHTQNRGLARLLRSSEFPVRIRLGHEHMFASRPDGSGCAPSDSNRHLTT
jgi:hypothetical protein